jgi:hypothetical protein
MIDQSAVVKSPAGDQRPRAPPSLRTGGQASDAAAFTRREQRGRCRNRCCSAMNAGATLSGPPARGRYCAGSLSGLHHGRRTPIRLASDGGGLTRYWAVVPEADRTSLCRPPLPSNASVT